MENRVYVVATLKPWNIQAYHRTLKHLPGRWHLVTDPAQLTVERVRSLAPRYIFFPHWSEIVPAEILALTECVCFHETDLPFGRGGSPIQNLIERGQRETVITALRMVEELDAGPVYMKQPLSLEGGGEEVYLRAASLVAEMIAEMIEQEPEPLEQVGEPVVFQRRTPQQSEVPSEMKGLEQLFDHIRMLDAEGYPKACFTHGHYRFELSRPALKTGEIVADVRITRIEDEER